MHYIARGQDLVGSYRSEGHPSDSQTPLGYKEGERARSSVHYIARGQGLVGSYRSEGGGGILGHPSDSQTPLGYKERERTRSSVQQSSSSPVPSGAFLPVC